MKLRIEKPFLWFTQSINGEPKPWNYFEIDGVMVNAYEVLRKRCSNLIMREGIHNYLNFKGHIMIDSGGFLFVKKNIPEMHPNKILELYERSKPDIGVILDYPILPNLPEKERKRRLCETLENTRYMVAFHKGKNPMLMPVIHGHSLRSVSWFVKQLNIICDFEMYGIGSLVPSVFNTKGAGGIYNVVKIVSFIRKIIPDKKLHVFGVGSTLTMHLMFYIGADSVDSSGWRTKAAYGAIQLPGTPDRYITIKKKHKNYPRLSREEMNILDDCVCPSCRRISIDGLMRSYQLRALHNAWVLQNEVNVAKRLVEENTYDDYVERILKNSRFYKVFRYAKRLKLGK